VAILSEDGATSLAGEVADIRLPWLAFREVMKLVQASLLPVLSMLPAAGGRSSIGCVDSSTSLLGDDDCLMINNHRHRPHDPTEHDHVHGDGCGHRAEPHDDHVDYLHNGHWHAPHDGHYDEHPNLDH
jgi:hypothetical protein